MISRIEVEKENRPNKTALPGEQRKRTQYFPKKACCGNPVDCELER